MRRPLIWWRGKSRDLQTGSRCKGKKEGGREGGADGRGKEGGREGGCCQLILRENTRRGESEAGVKESSPILICYIDGVVG